MIQKKIHYCWFGGKEKPKIIKKCLKSWKENLQEYEIIEWNETNFNIDSNKFTKEAYKAKKFAFVSDYVRLFALYNYGGIYLDTDVKVFKNFDCLLGNESFWGFEEKNYIATSTIGAKKGNIVIKKFMELYNNKDFTQITNVIMATELLIEFGIKMDGSFQKLEKLTVYPQNYFSPYDYINYISNKNNETFTIHYFHKSWLPFKEKIKKYIKIFIVFILGVKFLNKCRELKGESKC